jgi:hypothetical protein
VVLPDLAHDVMLDTKWQIAADAVLAWLADLPYRHNLSL